ncbi:MAG: stage V sporulation protein AD [bacterium]|nr:stage V sporulation protein AD [bacterium]
MATTITRTRRRGRQTISFELTPAVVAAAAVVGPKEGQGPLGDYFDVVKEDDLLGEKSWERAEARMLTEACRLALRKAGHSLKDVDYLVAGDLLNQITSSSFVARELKLPFLGIFGACSTFAEGMAVGSMMIDGGYATSLLVGVSSHHCTAERQFRFPTEFGNQPPPSAQWTVTGAGAVLMAAQGDGPAITMATIGRVTDPGLKDPLNLGAAMAPAAADTILRHFEDTGRTPEDYDLIVTGDLADVGKQITADLLERKGLDVAGRLFDCGSAIYEPSQGVESGASGCGCSAAVFSGYLMQGMLGGRYRRLLLVCTGALFSPTSYQQGESIPGIAHAVALETQDAPG